MLSKINLKIVGFAAAILCFALLVVPVREALAVDFQKIVLTRDEQSLVDIINQERVRRGLPSLKVDSRLVYAARLKAGFDGGSCFIGKLVRDAGVKYSSVGQVSGKTGDIDLVARILLRSYARYLIFKEKYDRVGVGALNEKSLKSFSIIFVGGAGQRVIPPATGTVGRPEPQPGPEPPPALEPQPQPAPVQQPQPQPQPASVQQQKPDPSVNQLTADEKQMFDLINQERVKAGVRPLSIDMQLVKIARLKASDMIEKGYFSHTSPTYGSPFEMMRSFGVTYRYAGENLAGAPTVSLAHKNLMNSPGHRANILNSHFTKVGIGIVDGGPYGKMFVQMFTG